MRKIIFIIILLFNTTQAFAANFTKNQMGVGTANTTANQSSVSIAFGSAPLAGDLVTCEVMYYDGTATAPTITVKDGNNNVYTVNVTSAYGSSACLVVQAYLLSAPSNANKTITATFSKSDGSGPEVGIFCDDWMPNSGTKAIFDSASAANSGTSSGTGVINTPTVKVTGASDLIYCGGCPNGGITSANAPLTINEGSPALGIGAEWDNGVSSSTACNFQETLDNDPYQSAGISFTTTSIPANIINKCVIKKAIVN